MISTQQTQQAAPQQIGPLNEQKKTRLRSDMKQAAAELESRRETYAALRKGLADAAKDLADAQEMLLAAKKKESRLRTEFQNAADAHAQSQGKLNTLQGQLQQLEALRIGG